MTGLDEFFATVPEADVLHALPDGVSVTFELTGEGGGTWTVARRGGRTEVRRRRESEPRALRGAGANPDCHLSCTVSDFRALIRGELDPRRGFLEGRLAVEGDVGLVLRLQRTMGR